MNILSVILFIFADGNTGGRVALADEEKPTQGGDLPEVVRLMAQGDLGPAVGHRVGVVTGVKPGSITVEFVDPYKERTTETDPQGHPFRKVTLVYPPLAPQEMQLSDLLANGKAPEKYGVSYRAADLCIGDKINVGYTRSRAGVWSCEHITVFCRPGGKVPPASYDKTPEVKGYRWHEWMQAKQDFEEKGVAIPARFLPGYKDRIAPMPREVTVPRISGSRP